MNPIRYFKRGILGLSMLASAAFGFDPSLRQTEVTAGYDQDSTKSWFTQLHHQREKNDALLKVDKKENPGFDGYLLWVRDYQDRFHWR